MQCTRQVDAVATEAQLLDAFVDAVRALDPDILVGYDVRKVQVLQDPSSKDLS